MTPDLKHIVRFLLGAVVITWATIRQSIPGLAVLATLGLVADFVWAWSRKVDTEVARKAEELSRELEGAIADAERLQARLEGAIEPTSKGGPNF